MNLRQNLTILIVLVLILLLGLWGQYELAPSRFSSNFLEALYQVLTLFAFEGDWTQGIDLPWQLEATRLLAPVASVAGVLFILTRGAWIEVLNWFVRYRQDQVVVAGLAQSSFQFIRSCAPRYNVVVIEENPNNALIDAVRDMNVAVIVGDVMSPHTYARVNLQEARHLVVFTGNDGANVELTMKAREYVREKNGAQLRIHLHLDNGRMAQYLENYPKFFSDHSVAEISFFSVYDLNARILFDTYPPDVFAHSLGQTRVHMALYQFDRLAENILLEGARVCHYANESTVRFTVLDPDAEAKRQTLLSSYPQLPLLNEIEFIEISPLNDVSSIERLPESLLQTVTQHVTCLATDEENLELALILRTTLLRKTACNAPILVHMESSTGLAQLLESNFGGPEVPDGLYPFGMLDEVLSYENVLSDGLDALARAIHADYLERRQDLEVDRRLYKSLNDWNMLPEPERKSSRLQADHLETKLRAVGCRLSADGDPNFRFTDEEAELLARMEHNRWRANKIFEGWRPGPDRIEGAKITPYAVTWDEMDEAERRQEVKAVKRYPLMLSGLLGRHLQRNHYIGITGHRLHKLDVEHRELQDSLDGTLREIVDDNPGKRLVLVSPLAEGADRLVASLAVERFGMALQVPLPLPYELYHTDFSAPNSIEAFKMLVGKAEFYFELPMRFGSLEDLAMRLESGANENRNRQYALAGAYLVDNCHDLIAVYDGNGEEGVGGTGQVVRWRKAGAVDPEYVLAGGFFPEVPCNPPIIIEPKP